MATRRLDVRAPLALLAVGVIWTGALVAARLAPHTPAVAVAAVVDLAGSAALALYVIAVRRGHLPRWTVPVTVTIGLAIGRGALGHRAGAGSVVMATAAGIELLMLAMTIIGARRALRSWRSTRGLPRLDRVDRALHAVGMPARVARVVATEVTLFTFAATGWRAPAPSPARFTVHRVNGWALFVGVLVFLTVVETAVAHLVLATFVSATVAWVVSALSLYGVAWLLGDLHALRHGGVTVTDAGLELALGVRWSGTLPWAAITSIEAGTLAGKQPGVIDASIMGANVIVTLATPVELTGLLGRRRTATRVGLSIDDPARFTSLRRTGPGPA